MPCKKVYGNPRVRIQGLVLVLVLVSFVRWREGNWSLKELGEGVAQLVQRAAFELPPETPGITPLSNIQPIQLNPNPAVFFHHHMTVTHPMTHRDRPPPAGPWRRWPSGTGTRRTRTCGPPSSAPTARAATSISPNSCPAAASAVARNPNATTSVADIQDFGISIRQLIGPLAIHNPAA